MINVWKSPGFDKRSTVRITNGAHKISQRAQYFGRFSQLCHAWDACTTLDHNHAAVCREKSGRLFTSSSRCTCPWMQLGSVARYEWHELDKDGWLSVWQGRTRSLGEGPHFYHWLSRGFKAHACRGTERRIKMKRIFATSLLAASIVTNIKYSIHMHVCRGSRYIERQFILD